MMEKRLERKVSLRLEQVVEVLNAEVLVSPEGWKELMINAACGSDLMSDVLTHIKPNCILLTGLTNPQVIRTAEIADIKAICFVRGKKPEKEVLDLAKERDIPIFASKLPMFESCGRLYQIGMRGVSEIGD